MSSGDRLRNYSVPIGEHSLRTAKKIAEQMTAQAYGITKITQCEVVRRACVIGLAQLAKDMNMGETK